VVGGAVQHLLTLARPGIRGGRDQEEGHDPTLILVLARRDASMGRHRHAKTEG
jgi:hypothetical protein